MRISRMRRRAATARSKVWNDASTSTDDTASGAGFAGHAYGRRSSLAATCTGAAAANAATDDLPASHVGVRHGHGMSPSTNPCNPAACRALTPSSAARQPTSQRANFAQGETEPTPLNEGTGTHTDALASWQAKAHPRAKEALTDNSHTIEVSGGEEGRQR